MNFRFLIQFIILSFTINIAYATLKDGKNIVYSLPRPGVSEIEDCYVDMYSDEINRDIKIMAKIGFTSILTLNPWNFGLDHNVLLSALSKNNMTLGVAFKPDLDGIARKNLRLLKEQVDLHNVSLEFVFLDYPLDFDNAEDFFIWTFQVKGWMTQQNITAPLLVRFFPEVTSDATIKTLLERWDTISFDGWVIEKYSVKGMKEWMDYRLKDHVKKVFFLYGSDNWNTSVMENDYESQENQLEELVKFMTQTHPESPLSNYSQLLGSAILSYSDISYLGRSASYFLGGKGDICPDKNPYLKTSCGGRDENIKYGDTYYSIEHMGIFESFEGLMFSRCVKPTLSVKKLMKLWTGDDTDGVVNVNTCVMTLSVPGGYIYFFWVIGLVLAIAGIITGCCKSCCNERRKLNKINKLDNVVVEEQLISKKTKKKKSKKTESDSS